MAYNPFSIFRRNQKAIFAVVTVVIMFMFVLSSGMTGKADFFNWLPEWVRGKAKKGDALCVLDGDRIYPRDLEVLRRQRMMASKFMIEAAQETGFALNKELIELKTKATPQVVQKVQTAAMMEQFGQAGSVDRSIQEILDSPLSKEADKEMARLMRVSSSLFGSLGIAQRAGTYFATAANRPGNDRDVVEFMLWEKKAAQMGIEFSEDNVKQLIQKEFMGFFPSDVNVRKAMEREFPGFTLEACLKALAAEFRVRSAQTALLGLSTRSDHTLTALPLFNPVYELFEFYREKSSPKLHVAHLGAIDGREVNLVQGSVRYREPDAAGGGIRSRNGVFFAGSPTRRHTGRAKGRAVIIQPTVRRQCCWFRVRFGHCHD